jgi:protoporphyrinogen oxidase
LTERKKIIIVGSGIAGLTCAYYLRKGKVDADIRVFEKSERLGGRIYTLNYNDLPIDIGASHFHIYYFGLFKLLSDLGLESRVVTQTGESAIFTKSGHIVGLKSGKFMHSPYISPLTKLSLVSMAFNSRNVVAEGNAALERFDKSSTLDFFDIVRESPLLRGAYETNFGESLNGVFNRGLSDSVIAPIVLSTLSSNLDAINVAIGRAVMTPLFTKLLRMKNGMSEIIYALTNDFCCSVFFSTPILAIKRDDQRNDFEIKTVNGTVRADYVVWAAPINAPISGMENAFVPVSYSSSEVFVIEGNLVKELRGLKKIFVADPKYGVASITTYGENVVKINAMRPDADISHFFVRGLKIIKHYSWPLVVPQLSETALQQIPSVNYKGFYQIGDYKLPCMELSIQGGMKVARELIRLINS